MPAEDREKNVKILYQGIWLAHANAGWGYGELCAGNNYYRSRQKREDQKGLVLLMVVFFTKDDNKPAQYPSVVIAVDSIKRSMNKVAKAGGKVLGEPMEIPGYGMYVSFFDTEGNRVRHHGTNHGNERKSGKKNRYKDIRKGYSRKNIALQSRKRSKHSCYVNCPGYCCPITPPVPTRTPANPFFFRWNRKLQDQPWISLKYSQGPQITST